MRAAFGQGVNLAGPSISLEEVLQQSLRSMDSLDRLSERHEKSFKSNIGFSNDRRHRQQPQQHWGGQQQQQRLRHPPPDQKSHRGAPPRGHAARSHEQNERYMNDWHQAYNNLEQMGKVPSSSSSTPRRSSARRRTGNVRPQVAARAGRRRTAAPSARTGMGGAGAAIERVSLGSARGGRGGWKAGPEGKSSSPPIEIRSSGRNILCMTVQGDEAVVGSSDHALYAYDLGSGMQTRQMYNKRNGHKEWVTCACHTSDGRVVSGGMDSRLILWGARGATCHELSGHTGSISVVKASDRHPVVLSGSYDKTVRTFDLRTRRQIACFQGHRGPILDLDWAPGLAVSGGRDGVAMAWDVNNGSRIGALKGHKGHVTAVRWLRASSDGSEEQEGYGGSEASIFLTGAQDGHVRVWDLRAKREIANIPCHVNKNGTGAVAGLEVSSDLRTVASAGADRTICMMDARKGFQIRHRACEHRDFIYSVKAVDNYVVSGGGDGSLYCHSMTEDRVLWGVKPLQNAVRCIGATKQRLIVAGDDGSAIIYKFA